MNLLLVGLSHKTAPVHVRERLAFSSKQMAAALSELVGSNGERGTQFSEAVILSTCNRVEIYVTQPDGHAGVEKVKRFLAEFHKIDLDEFSPYLYKKSDLGAVEHLFAVTAGIDSMVIGETQIQGQVKQALAWAQQFQAAGPLLSALFTQALKVGKRVRTETSISERSLSISSAAVKLVQERFADLAPIRVLIIGVGKMSLLAVKNLVTLGCRDIAVVNRTPERTAAFAKQFRLKSFGFDRLESCLQEADVVISSTAAPHVVLTMERMKKVLPRRDERPLLIIDIAVPRDVEPEVQTLPGVTLHNIDELRTEVESNLARRCSEVSRVRAIIEEEVVAFGAWHRAQAAKPVILGLRQKAEEIRAQELERALRRFNGGLSEREQRILNDLSRRIINRILHQPLTRLKEQTHAGNGELYAAALKNLFDLEDYPK